MNPELLSIVAIGISMVTLIALVIAALLRGDKSSDVSAIYIERLQALQNSEHMDRLERAYQAQNETVRQSIAAFTRIMDALTPYIPTDADEATVDFLKDIQTPGKPDGMAEAAHKVYGVRPE